MEEEKMAHEYSIGCFSRNGGVDACATCMCHMSNSGYRSGQVQHIGSDGVERHLSDNRSKRSNRKAAGEPGKVSVVLDKRRIT